MKYNELARSEFDQSGNLIKGADLLFLGGGKNVSSNRNKKALFFELEKIFSENLDVLFATRYEKSISKFIYQKRKYPKNQSKDLCHLSFSLLIGITIIIQKTK